MTAYIGIDMSKRKLDCAGLRDPETGQSCYLPTESNIEYYRQRADAALIIGKAAQVSFQGKDYSFTHGVHSQAQIEGWREITEAMHAAGGRILLQPWHIGRISRCELQPDSVTPVAFRQSSPKAP